MWRIVCGSPMSMSSHVDCPLRGFYTRGKPRTSMSIFPATAGMRSLRLFVTPMGMPMWRVSVHFIHFLRARPSGGWAKHFRFPKMPWAGWQSVCIIFCVHRKSMKHLTSTPSLPPIPTSVSALPSCFRCAAVWLGFQGISARTQAALWSAGSPLWKSLP